MARLQHHIIKKVRINQLNYECPSNNWHFVVPQLITMTGKRKLQKFKLPIGIFCGDHRSFKHTTEELWSVAIALPLHWMVQQKPFPFFFPNFLGAFLELQFTFLMRNPWKGNAQHWPAIGFQAVARMIVIASALHAEFVDHKILNVCRGHGQWFKRVKGFG